MEAMRLSVAGLGLLVIAAIACAVFGLTVKRLEAVPPPFRHPERARLVSVPVDDERWLGRYRLLSEAWIEFLPGGLYRESLGGHL